MIDDATLVEWERYADVVLDRRCPSPSECQDPCQTDHSFALAVRLLEATAEIRRLREYQEYFAPGVTELQAALVAHQAVVRELSEALEGTLAEIHYNHGCDASCEAMRHASLTLPLVVAAREEERDAVS